MFWGRRILLRFRTDRETRFFEKTGFLQIKNRVSPDTKKPSFLRMLDRLSSGPEKIFLVKVLH